MGRKYNRTVRRIEANVRNQDANNGRFQVETLSQHEIDQDIEPSSSPSDEENITFQWFAADDSGGEEHPPSDNSSLGAEDRGNVMAEEQMGEDEQENLMMQSVLVPHTRRNTSEDANNQQSMMAEIYYEGMMKGASLTLMDDIVQLIRTRARAGLDITKLPRRETFMKNLRISLGDAAPPLPENIQVLGGPEIPRFPFLGQILDLLNSTDFQESKNLVVNSNKATIFGKFIPAENESLLEINSGKWYSDTYDKLVKDPANEWLFPLIFYIDKTGTDAMQRFPLEPLMVSTANIRQSEREKASAWRHVGFVPPFDLPSGTKQSHFAEENLQMFHKCLAVLLEDLATLQRERPVVNFTLDGIEYRKTLVLPVAFVMGDQLSQDKHCGRRAVNAGGAGRIHRRCMCSSLNASNTKSQCQAVNKHDIDAIVSLALQGKKIGLDLEEKLRAKFAKKVLEKCYSMYAIDNAWANICFGTNAGGIYGATLDDPMHYCDSGSFKYIAEVAFLSMQKLESGKFETLIQQRFHGLRSSVREDLPKGKYTTGFTRTTLLTAAEKVGLVFSLFLLLGMEVAEPIFSEVILRMQSKYQLDSTDMSSDLPRRGDVYFFSDHKSSTAQPTKARKMDRTLNGVNMAVKRMSLHKLTSIFITTKYDTMQTEYLLMSVHTYLNSDEESVVRQHKLERAELVFASHLHSNLRQYQELVPESNRKRKTQTTTTASTASNNTSRTIRHIEKHHLVRKREPGLGVTAAILKTLPEFRKMLVKMLSFHSFIHYFEEVTPSDRTDIKKIQHSLEDLIGDYASCIYRGDDTVDCDTCKLHSHLHLAYDIQSYGHPMNWEAGKGERGLKTWAKMPANTAQKINITTFTHQTAMRTADVSLLRKAISDSANEPTPRVVMETNAKLRKFPHFWLDIQRKITTYRVSKKGKKEDIKNQVHHKQTIKYLAQMEQGIDLGTVMIWKEAVLNIDGVQKRVRACSEFDRFGEFYDWVMVEWSPDNSLYPARMQVIYKDRDGEYCAIIHGSEWANHAERKKNTKISERRTLECNKGLAVLRKIRLADIKDVIYVVEHCVRCPKSLGLDGVSQNRNARKHPFDVVTPRYEWAREFLIDSYVEPACSGSASIS